MSLNVTKTKSMFFSLRDNISLNKTIELNDTEIENVYVFKLLRVHIDNHLRFDTHVDVVTSKARSRTYSLVVHTEKVWSGPI